jgi:hypothetical protein
LVDTWARPQPDGPDAGQTLVAAFPDVSGDLLGVLERRGRLELDVEGDQRRPHSDEGGAGGGMEVRGAEVGRELPGVDAALELRGPPTSERGAGAATREDAVEEHGEVERHGQAVGEDERLGGGGAAILLAEVDDRRDVDGTHAGVDALVRLQIDGGDGLSGPADDGLGQLAGVAREGVRAAVVVGVGVDVEEGRAEGVCDPVDGGLVAALRYVGVGQQRGRQGRRMLRARPADERDICATWLHFCRTHPLGKRTAQGSSGIRAALIT